MRQAWLSLVEQRGRSLLSAVGIMIGSVAVVLLVSIAVGVRKQMLSSVQELGVNTLIVLPGKVTDIGGFNPNMMGTSYLREEMATNLRSIPGVVRTSPLIFAGGGIKYGAKEDYPFVIAATSDWFLMKPNVYKYGEPFTNPRESAKVAVIGSVASKTLFGEVNPVGKEVEINGGKYRVVAVTQDPESESSLFSAFGLQNVVYIPFHSFITEVPDKQIQRIMVEADPGVEPKPLVAAIEKQLGSKLKEQQFSVVTNDQLQGLIYKFMSILTWLVTGLTSIALLVGGFGILAVMLMSVGERTKEIGVRKTVGATNRAIFRQFFSEALLLTFLGASAGVLIAAVAVVLIYRFTPVKPLITFQIVLLAFGMCLAVGLGAALAPAMRAARKEPVDALRHE